MTRMRLLYFASVREVLDRDGDDIAFPAHILTVGQCIDWLVERDDAYRAAFADRGRLRFALDQQMVQETVKIGGAEELAIFPPVTGG